MDFIFLLQDSPCGCSSANNFFFQGRVLHRLFRSTARGVGWCCAAWRVVVSAGVPPCLPLPPRPPPLPCLPIPSTSDAAKRPPGPSQRELTFLKGLAGELTMAILGIRHVGDTLVGNEQLRTGPTSTAPSRRLPRAAACTAGENVHMRGPTFFSRKVTPHLEGRIKE